MKHASVADICVINPRVPASISSQKELDVDFVPMANVGEDGRLTLNQTRKLGEVLKGYTYFEKGDVLVAKITPCMENGKAAYVRNLQHGIAFGSTEFHVLRPSLDVDARYLFYMIWTPQFRLQAAKNMTGTAGQQRVPANFFDRFQILLPPMPQQLEIAETLDLAFGIWQKHVTAASIAKEMLDSLVQRAFQGEL